MSSAHEHDNIIQTEDSAQPSSGSSGRAFLDQAALANLAVVASISFPGTPETDSSLLNISPVAISLTPQNLSASQSDAAIDTLRGKGHDSARERARKALLDTGAAKFGPSPNPLHQFTITPSDFTLMMPAVLRCRTAPLFPGAAALRFDFRTETSTAELEEALTPLVLRLRPDPIFFTAGAGAAEDSALDMQPEDVADNDDDGSDMHG